MKLKKGAGSRNRSVVCSFFNPINQWGHFRGGKSQHGTKVCIRNGANRCGDGDNSVCNGYAFHKHGHGDDAAWDSNDADGARNLTFWLCSVYNIYNVYDKFCGNVVYNIRT
jgi:hypothetical protein